ncbi:hypothetical protein BBJ28_00009155 [Nothophytophthora sp. Chile5]|nr:hypothetical protein BBJ28_00009155 [Nothophytophthora sp. Chile5]
MSGYGGYGGYGARGGSGYGQHGYNRRGDGGDYASRPPSGYDDHRRETEYSGGYGGGASHSGGYDSTGCGGQYDERPRGGFTGSYGSGARYGARGYGSSPPGGYGGGYNSRGYGGGRGGHDERPSAYGHGDFGGRYNGRHGGGFAGRGDHGYDDGSGRDDHGYSRLNGRDTRPDGDRSGGGGHGLGGEGDRFGGRGGHFGNGGGHGGGQFGGGGSRGEQGPGVGEVIGSGYEHIGTPVMDPHLRKQWSGRTGPREVPADDAELQQEFRICQRPGVAKGGKTVHLEANYFGLSLDLAPAEIFKYHVDVTRTPEPEANTVQQSQQQRPERPLPRSFARNVINAALRQYESEFGGIRVVHDGMSALYSPTMLPWNAKDFGDVNPDGVSVTPAPPPAGGDAAAAGEGQRRGYRGPRTFVVKMKLAETISTSSLADYYSNPDVNVMPVLQALDVAARHLGAQRLIAVGRNFFTMKKTHPLKGGKELCWGYHQSIRVADRKLLMNIDQAATVFYAPGELMQLVLAALNARSPNEVRNLSERDMKKLAGALRKIEVVPTHRKDRKRAIFGVSATPADQTVVSIKGESMSVAAYFSKKYNMQLRFPNLPLVNVGSKRPGKENWLPIEVCDVSPGQRCANINNLDTAEIIKQTSQPPKVRQGNIMDQIRQAGFENDPYLAAFGMNVGQRLETAEAHVMDAPEVQYENVSERPKGGQWSLNGKKFVEGVPLRNWGVIIVANVGERNVQSFVSAMCNLGNQRGLPIEDSNPYMIHQDQHHGAQVEELMTMCFKELEMRNKGPPQLLLVILPDKHSSSYGDVKRMSDTVLGIPSQCIASVNLPRANPQFCANVCLKINMKLNGKNAVLREPLPLVGSSPTIIIGADVEHPRSGIGSRPSIAAVVASMDRYSAQYASRVAAQKASSDIQQLPLMLRDLFLAYYVNTSRKPEHVIYYRDGVSEGQFHDILQTEMRALRKAFKMISEDYNPPVTFIIVNKRHHVRAFPVNPRDADRKGNVMPGTVIDTGIVNPHRFDFYLYGHSGIQGTTVPAHYTVLHDENKMSAEDVQRLTYHLGYTYARCTRSVSLVTPVYYAHLAATRARFFLNEGSDGASTVGSYNSNASSFEFAEVHTNLLNRMFYT